MITSEINELLLRSRRVKDDLLEMKGEARALALRGKKLKEEVDGLKAKLTMLDQAAAILASIGEERQAAAQKQIETLVTRGLQTIFEEDYTFHLVQSTRGKQPTVEFMVRSHLANGEVVETEVMSARGGGLATVVGFLLRLVVLLLSPSKQETVLFLDESFGMLSAEYEVRMAEFLREIVDKSGVQIIMVTHSTAFSDVADKQYRFDLHKGITRVTESTSV